MTTYKITKRKLGDKIFYDYRGFTIKDDRGYNDPYANWTVKNPEGQLVVSHTETKKQSIEWIDSFCEEMNDSINEIDYNELI
tara:strand:- start:138 stop:383 length:246 start_codon:yes stop_codon:yes gene_type:complete